MNVRPSWQARHRPYTAAPSAPSQCAQPRGRRATVIVAVIWAIAVGGIIAASIQLSAFRQASFGRDTLERVQARWGARSGIESTLATLADYTTNPVPEDAYATFRAMELASVGTVGTGSWDIRHARDDRNWLGPMDEHSKLHVLRSDSLTLLILNDMTPDVADAMQDWFDADSDVRGFGIERDYYQSLSPPIEPRNDRPRSIGELELVAGIWPTYLRAEDWDLDSRMDPGEDDGRRSWPEDDDDGILDAGWSSHLTVYTRAGGATESGKPRLQLKRASVDDIVERIGATEMQALALIAFGRNSSNRLDSLRTVGLANIDITGTAQAQPVSQAEPLTEDQVRMVMDEFSIEHSAEWIPGRMNINTVPKEFFLDMFPLNQPLAEEIIAMRNNQAEGIVSLLDLLDLPEVDDQMWTNLSDAFCTRSNVFTIASKGRSEVTGAEVEIIVVVDRSTMPIRILEYREQ